MMTSLCFKGLVFAGLADYNRPAEKLSVTQSTALAATGEPDVSHYQQKTKVASLNQLKEWWLLKFFIYVYHYWLSDVLT